MTNGRHEKRNLHEERYAWNEPGANMAETGSTSYWVVIDGKNFKTGKPLASKRYGPYASQEEAELAEADLIPWGDSGDHVHRIHIEAEPGTQGTG